jgi:hypothetical protein
MNKTNGKIAEQSKQKMAAALLTVMKQYDYHEITVTQITQEASFQEKLFIDFSRIKMLFWSYVLKICLRNFL